MFSFQLLRSSLADLVLSRIEMPLISTPTVGVITANAQRGEQRFELQQCLVLAATKDIRHQPARLVIQRLPEPPRLFLAADKRPHFVQFRLFYFVKDHFRF